MRRALPTLLTLALVLAAPACGDDGDEPAATTTSTTVAPETIPEDTEPDRSADRERFVIAPVLSSGGCPPEVSAPTVDGAEDPASDGEDEAAAPDGEEVEGGDGADDGETDGDEPVSSDDEPVSTTVPAGPAAPGGPLPTADGVFCYTVGEPFADGNDLTDATLSEAGGAFQVVSHVKPESTEALNAGFNACFTGQPSCPPGEGGYGYAAVIWGDVVLYAPAIQVEDLADGVLSLGGGLTERRARDLVTLINR